MKSQVTGFISAVFFVVESVLNLGEAITPNTSSTPPQIFREPNTRGQTMGLVLCITRGGEGGIRTQDEAIALARGLDECLVFLYVLDTSFLNKIVLYVNRRLAVEELVKLGEFLLVMAVERALTVGVKAKAVVRTGMLHKILPMVVLEMEATTIVLESHGGETCIVNEANLEDFLESSK